MNRLMMPLLFCFLFLVQGFALIAPAHASKKVALVIGNSIYSELSSLEKPAEDAEGYTSVLSAKGFNVSEVSDANLIEMKIAIGDFIQSIAPGDIAAFVYAGHGWSNGSTNFLLPVDAPREGSPITVESLSIPVKNGHNGIIDLMSSRGAELKVVIIDACRDLPFASDSILRSGAQTRGLTKVDPPRGTFVAFSAGAGETALDRISTNDSERYSVFTRIFLPLLESDRTLLSAIKIAQEEVSALAAKIDHQQNPAYYDELKGQPCLGGECPEQLGPQPFSVDPDEAQRAFLAAQSSGSKAALEAVALHYGDTVWGKMAAAAAASIQVKNQGGFQVGALPTASPPPTRKAEILAKCDREAAYPPLAPTGTQGKWSDFINIDSALNACRVAYDTAPEVPRMAAWLSRIEKLAGNYERSLELAVKADGDGYAFGSAILADHYQKGQGVQQDFARALNLHERSIERGSTVGLLNKAGYYLHGLGVKQSDAEALKLFREAHSAGSASASGSLAWAYKQGRGVDRDYDKALAYYQEAISRGWFPAYLKIGDLYRDRTDEHRNYSIAMEWYRKGLREGDVFADTKIAYARSKGQGLAKDNEIACRVYLVQARITKRSWPIGQSAWCYKNGYGVEKDIAQAYNLYLESAHLGSTHSMIQIGNFFLNGIHVEENIDEAIRWYKKAANAKSADAYVNIADIYYKGNKAEQNYERTYRYALLGAERGSAWGMNFVGVLNEKGLGVEKNVDLGVEWYVKAAEAGNMTAISNIASVFKRKKLYEEAGRVYEKGVELRHVDSMVNLANMHANQGINSQSIAKAKRLYERALEIEPENKWALRQAASFYVYNSSAREDANKGVEFYKRAAQLGDSSAAINLSRIYMDGEKLPKDLEKALRWAKRAKELEHRSADEAIEKITKELSIPTSVNTERKDFVTPIGGFVGDVIDGIPAAQHELIVYSSLGCGACADFYNVTLSEIRAKYISTGRLKFIFRDFPLDQKSTTAAIAARCQGRDRYLDFVSLFFGQQSYWNVSDNAAGYIKSLATANGLAPDKLEACLNDDALKQGIIDASQRARNDGVTSTPTFFINGSKYLGNRNDLQNELARIIGN